MQCAYKPNQPNKILSRLCFLVNDFPTCLIILFFLGIFFFLSPKVVFAVTPDQISGLKLWLNASQGVTTDGSTPVVDGNTVQQWNDQSGGGFNATQLTAG